MVEAGNSSCLIKATPYPVPGKRSSFCIGRIMVEAASLPRYGQSEQSGKDPASTLQDPGRPGYLSALFLSFLLFFPFLPLLGDFGRPRRLKFCRELWSNPCGREPRLRAGTATYVVPAFGSRCAG